MRDELVGRLAARERARGADSGLLPSGVGMSKGFPLDQTLNAPKSRIRRPSLTTEASPVLLAFLICVARDGQMPILHFLRRTASDRCFLPDAGANSPGQQSEAGPSMGRKRRRSVSQLAHAEGA